jgi:hypothetical protein
MDQREGCSIKFFEVVISAFGEAIKSTIYIHRKKLIVNLLMGGRPGGRPQPPYLQCALLQFRQSNLARLVLRTSPNVIDNRCLYTSANAGLSIAWVENEATRDITTQPCCSTDAAQKQARFGENINSHWI